MRVCMVAEGCYPYVVGGVSGWINSMIRSFPNIEFILVAIVATREQSGKFSYELPENLTEVHEVFLEDVDWGESTPKTRLKRLHRKQYNALRSLLLNRDVQWNTLFELFHDPKVSINDILMGPNFYEIAREVYELKYSQIVFSDYLWTMRSIYLPLFLILKAHVPAADLYHCVATGYSGVLGAMAQYFHKCSLLISEHGIYTREREEELIRATWVDGKYKSIWIDQFRKMSTLAYDRADRVTCLYDHARELQIGLGCPPAKIIITPNGVNTQRLADIPGKTEEDRKFVNIGAVLRVTPIKDVKTMIQAFAFAKQRISKLKLWIMGPTEEDPQYAQECFDLVEALEAKDVVFTGRIDVREYLGRMDMTVLTSISEGQPLTILEGFAAKKPAIATDVGNCRGLLYGEGDDFGEAGILTHIMNIEEIAQAMVELGRDEPRRIEMGEAGYKRLMSRYKIEDMHETYEELYKRFAKDQGLLWLTTDFVVGGLSARDAAARKASRKPERRARAGRSRDISRRRERRGSEPEAAERMSVEEQREQETNTAAEAATPKPDRPESVSVGNPGEMSAAKQREQENAQKAEEVLLYPGKAVSETTGAEESEATGTKESETEDSVAKALENENTSAEKSSGRKVSKSRDERKRAAGRKGVGSKPADRKNRRGARKERTHSDRLWDRLVFEDEDSGSSIAE